MRGPRWVAPRSVSARTGLLAALFPRALVRGMGAARVSASSSSTSQVKGAAIGGCNGSDAPIGPREIAEVHLPAARAANPLLH